MGSVTHSTLAHLNLLTETEGGVRVNLSALHMNFTQRERCRWYSLSTPIPYDQFGALPDAVEEFLRPRQREMF